MNESGGGRAPKTNWAVVMEQLLGDDVERRQAAFWKLNRLISKFLRELGAWNHRDHWDDLRQSVLRKLARSFREGQLRQPEAFVTYAKQITRNQFRDLLRSELRERGREPIDVDEIAAAEATTRTAAVRQAVEELPEILRAVVAARFWEGLTNEQGAAKLGMSTATFRRRLKEAVDILKAKMTAGTP